MIDLKWKEEVKGNPISNWLGRPDPSGTEVAIPSHGPCSDERDPTGLK